MIEEENLNDYELISLAQELNEDAIIILHEKYKPLILKKSRKYLKYFSNKGLELSDLIQECTIGFEEAIKDYNMTDDVTFYTFANICMDRQLTTEIRKQNRLKYRLLNEALPLEGVDEELDNFNLSNVIKDYSSDPETDLFTQVELEELYEKIIKELTDMEECVFNLKIQNFDCKEISDILDKNEKSIYNTLQRIKVKIKNMLS